MSQRAIFVRVDGNLVKEVFNHVPDYDDMVRICKDEGYDEYEGYRDYALVEYEWIEIGEGESGMDNFIDDEILLAIYDSYGWEEHIKSLFGLEVDTVESGSEEVLLEDIREDSYV